MNSNMDVYSKEIDEQVNEQVEKEFKKKTLPKNKDYLDIDPPIAKQSHFCVSFCPPKKTVLEEAETLCFAYFLAECSDRKELTELLQKEVQTTGNKETDEIERKRLLEEIFQKFIKRYTQYKKGHQVLLRNRLKDHFGKETRFDGLFKVRGAFKNEKKARDHAKEMSYLDGFPVFVGKVGHWTPFNQDKFTIKDYESANEKMNSLVRGYQEERKKAERAFGLRKDLLYRQGTKIAEEIKRKNQLDIKAGKYQNRDPWDSKEQRDIPMTEIQDGENIIEDDDPDTIEIDMLAPPRPIGPAGPNKTKIEMINEQFEKAGQVLTENINGMLQENGK